MKNEDLICTFHSTTPKGLQRENKMGKQKHMEKTELA